jgi:hypothetical protein
VRSLSQPGLVVRLAQRLGLLVGSSLLVVLLFEALLRLTSFPVFRPDDLTSVRAQRIERNAPYSYVVFDARLGWKLYPDPRVNVMVPEGLRAGSGFPGYRSTRSYALEGGENTKRIVAVGDSHTFGWRLRVTDAYPHLLESLCDGTEVINMAVPGYGVDQELLLLSEYGLRFSPDVVVVGFYPDDMLRNLVAFRAHERFPKPRFTLGESGRGLTYAPPPVGGEFLVDGSYLLGERSHVGPLSVGLWKHSRLFRLITVEGYKTLGYMGVGEAWKLNEAVLTEFATLAEQRSFELVVLFIPAEKGMNSLVGGIVYSRLEALMKEWATRRGVELLDLTPTFRELYGRESGLYLRDGHLGKAGHEVAAKKIAERTCESW